jgi:hypothetical protein
MEAIGSSETLVTTYSTTPCQSSGNLMHCQMQLVSRVSHTRQLFFIIQVTQYYKKYAGRTEYIGGPHKVRGLRTPHLVTVLTIIFLLVISGP